MTTQNTYFTHWEPNEHEKRLYEEFITLASLSNKQLREITLEEINKFLQNPNYSLIPILVANLAMFNNVVILIPNKNTHLVKGEVHFCYEGIIKEESIVLVFDLSYSQMHDTKRFSASPKEYKKFINIVHDITIAHYHARKLIDYNKYECLADAFHMVTTNGYEKYNEILDMYRKDVTI